MSRGKQLDQHDVLACEFIAGYDVSEMIKGLINYLFEKQLIKKANLKQLSIAAKTGYPYLNRLINGRSSPTTIFFWKLFGKFDLNPRDFMMDAERKKSIYELARKLFQKNIPKESVWKICSLPLNLQKLILEVISS